jgi:hypothetical protein
MGREAVLVMQVEVELSQRRGCGLMGCIVRRVVIESGDAKMNGCACVCARWPRPGGGLAIAVYRYCSSAKAGS